MDLDCGQSQNLPLEWGRVSRRVAPSRCSGADKVDKGQSIVDGPAAVEPCVDLIHHLDVGLPAAR